MSYKKVGPDHPMYDIIQHHHTLGMWACDAEDHNGPDGCPNPGCWKYHDKSKGKGTIQKTER